MEYSYRQLGPDMIQQPRSSLVQEDGTLRNHARERKSQIRRVNDGAH